MKFQKAPLMDAFVIQLRVSQVVEVLPTPATVPIVNYIYIYVTTRAIEKSFTSFVCLLMGGHVVLLSFCLAK